jgi:acyl-CoA synthetase (AMP-forming)/AMP-acid ligase II
MRVYDYFRRAEAFHPDRTAFISDRSEYSFSQMGERSRAIASAIAARFSDDARIAVYSPNDVEAFACVLGVFASGRCWLPLNAKNAVDENAYILANTECEGLFLHSSMAAHLAVFRQQVPSLKVIVCIDRELDGVPSLASFLAAGDGRLPEVEDAPDRLASILSTGGTTGRPKGVMWTHRVWETMVATFWMH